MGILSKLFGRGKRPIQAFREDLTYIGVADFLEKHAGSTTDERSLMVAHTIAVLSEECTDQEKKAMKKVLVATIAIESLDGWTFTVEVLGTILSASTDQEVQKLMKEVLSVSERASREVDRTRIGTFLIGTQAAWKYHSCQ